MNAHPAPHPTDRTLHAYGLGRLDDASAESVNSHLEGCPDCRQRVAMLSSDSFLGRLRDAQARPESLHPAVSSTDGLSMLGTATSGAAPPPAGSLPPGLADLPDYEIVRELGQGGMGVVYLAQNKLMGRLEVLKVVSGHLINRRGVLDRFLIEIRNAAQLQHPNIVTAYSALRLGESLALAMEYVDGFDLTRLVKAKGPLPLANACNYVHQAALGLQHAHEHGMVHRDIKPSNLMLTRQGSRALIKVLDFGLAKIKSEGAVDGGLTHEGQMLGTPHYIAPEQTIDARKADIRADIYSLGCTFYYLLTGEPPFEGVSLYDILQAHHSREALPLNLARPEVPVEVAALVAKMMAKEPERRFQEPKEVAQALKPFFKSGSVPSVGSRPEVSQRSRTVADQGSSKISTEPFQPVRAATPSSTAKKSPENEQPEPAWNSLINLRDRSPLHDSLLDSPGRAAGPAAKHQGSRAWWTAVGNLAQRVPGAWWTIAGVFLLCFAIAWGAGVIKVKTPDGVIVLEGVPADTLVEVDGGEITVTPTAGEPVKIKSAPGKHSLVVKRGAEELWVDSLTVVSGKQSRITVRIERPTPSKEPKSDKAAPPQASSEKEVVVRTEKESDVAPPIGPKATADERSTGPQSGIAESSRTSIDEEIRPFNGRTFEGWHGFTRLEIRDPSEIFRVEGDELAWNGQQGRIFTNDRFRDFSFKFEYLLPPNGRYGTTFCALQLAEGDPYRIDGVDFRIGGVYCALTNGGWGETGNIIVESYQTSNRRQIPIQRRANAAPLANEWNRVEIRCEGRVLSFFLNGSLVNRIEANQVVVCHPGFNSWDADIRFRNVRIAPLAKADSARASTKKRGSRVEKHASEKTRRQDH
jgi:serine/threonine protein kinase